LPTTIPQNFTFSSLPARFPSQLGGIKAVFSAWHDFGFEEASFRDEV
jgi:hypothetical protein